MHCPLQERFLEQQGSKPLHEEWEEALETVIRWYFFQLLDARRPDRDAVMVRWEKLWFKGKRPVDVMVKGIDQRTQAGVRGARLLENFLRHVQPTPGRPLLVAQSIVLRLGSVELTGEIPLVREITEGRKRIVEIVHYRIGSIPDKRFWIDSDLAVAFASWGFRSVYRGKEHRTRLVYLGDGKEFTLMVDDNLRSRFLNVVHCVLPQIERQAIWPRTGPHCRACPYKRQCIESWRD